MSTYIPLIFAVDPGSSRCAYAVLLGVGARVRYLEKGEFPATLEGFRDAMDRTARAAAQQPSLVAIEQPAGYVHDLARSKHLLATAGVAYAIDWVSRSQGMETVTLSAAEARKMVIGKSKLAFGRGEKEGDMDRVIKVMLPTFVDDFPKQSNEHARDAMLLGVAANWVWLGRQKRSA